MKKSGLFLAVVLLCGSALADVYSDAAAWWRFDKDFNEDGVAQANEIRDVRYWGSTNAAGRELGGYPVMYMYGPSGGPLWTNMVVDMPGRGMSYTGTTLYFPVNTNEEYKSYPCSMNVPNLGLVGSATAATRVFMQDIFGAKYNLCGYIYNNALNYSKFTGWMFGVIGVGGSPYSAYPVILIGRSSFYASGITLTTNTWYDIGVSVIDNGENDSVVFAVASAKRGFEYQVINVGTTVLSRLDASAGNIGAEQSFSQYMTYTNTNSGKMFHGAMQQLALWRRALSLNELAEAFGYPYPLFAVGTEDGSSGEFGKTNEAEYVYNVENPWHEMPAAVNTGHPALTLQLAVNDQDRQLAYAFHVKAAEVGTDGQNAGLGLTINGQSLGGRPLATGKDAWWFVPSNTLSTGANTIALSYNGGSAASLAFDKIEMTGSWQIGKEDNSQADFKQEGGTAKEYYICNHNPTNVTRAIISLPNDWSNNFVHFYLPERLAQKYYFNYSTRIIGQGRANTVTNYPLGLYPFAIRINGEDRYVTTGVPNGTYVAIPFKPGELQTGWNTIEPVTRGAGNEGFYYIQFDFHRLQMKDFPHGLVIKLMR